MGWTTYMATEYKNGKVDRKAECDKLFNWSSEKQSVTVRKSSMVGSTYYAAVQNINKEKGTNETFAVVCLTCGKGRGKYSDGMNFGYKDMDETEIPYQYDCPKSILNLLTPTDNENANEWRRLCREKAKQKKEGKTLSSLPTGTTIRFKKYNGDIVECYKHEPGYQFKRPFWMKCDGTVYIKANQIPKEFEIVSN